MLGLQNAGVEIGMAERPFVIAVDGTAASGKGTLSQALATKCGFAYLDTGKLYRAVALTVLKRAVDVQDVEAIVRLVDTIDFSDLAGSFLHTPEVSECASKIAVHGALRQRLYDLQRSFPEGHEGAVIDGRDIGTVIFPDADIKFFITASVEIRAQRRFKQLQSDQKVVEYSEVLKDLVARDHRDSSRQVSPTQAAEDAIVIDTSDMNVDAVVNLAYSLAHEHVVAHRGMA